MSRAGQQERTPRTPKTAEQASLDNAARFNTRELSRFPLWTGAGLEGELRELGVIRTRAPDHQLRLQADLSDRLTALRVQHAQDAEAYRLALKAADPEAYREALLSLRRMQTRFSSMRDPTKVCDHWHTRLRKALPTEQWRRIEVQVRPEAALAHQVTDDLDRRAVRRAQRAATQPLLPFGRGPLRP
ncbi:hypothetical protein [Deinococcus soli (ex Cha et al. 2016)]|uniref:hypothetical protein n=1 Tax=Deinococcus soli (ex Cha et al. 2016) TaxID=1309411 RepID=UPI00166A3B21|nr:hypothetical protein [Deinococcus soli (ex Cha et al. 2016)]GGB79303.1 hypothetical protein GCM10008019_39390 [Deinococcus soli (ex Cha et al. 2016)]